MIPFQYPKMADWNKPLLSHFIQMREEIGETERVGFTLIWLIQALDILPGRRRNDVGWNKM
jgi:hypothetical protein